MNLKKIHHAAIIVSDYRKSREFYVDKLGFEVIRENYRADRGDCKLDLQMGGCELELFGIAGAPKRLSYPEACGLSQASVIRCGRYRGDSEGIKRYGNRNGACKGG